MRLQQVELAIFDNFIKACEKLRVKYFVIGGTLLGAVRHGGFIPWDDDIDVGMPREDYDRFLKLGQQELKDCYFLQNYVTDPEITGPFAKIRDSRTTFIERSAKNRKINHGVYIDIFPLDGIPDNPVIRMINKFRITMLQIRISKYNYTESGQTGLRSIKGKIAEGLSKIYCAWLSLNSAQKKFDAIVTRSSYASSRYVTNHSGIYGNREIVPQECFGAGTTIKFDRLQVKAPMDYDFYLKNIYGNYMKLPPLEKRMPHHSLEKMDLDVPFTGYI